MSTPLATRPALVLVLCGILSAAPALAQQTALTLKLERVFGAAARGADGERPIFVEGDRIVTQGNVVVVEGAGSIRQGSTRVGSDRIEYDRVSEDLKADGEVTISRAGSLFSGPSLRLNLRASTGVFASPSYELLDNGGRGTASRVLFEGPKRSVLEGATYSTCPCDQEDWYLRADTLTLDNEQKEGEGRNASLHFRGLKLFTLPVFWFPLSDERRSGFLPPSLALTNRTGAELELPYYWNIAPNYDMTWTPRIMSRRGLQIGSHFRYLQPTFSGDLRAELNPSDRVTGDTRFQWSWQHRILNLGGWSGLMDLNGISDDEYFLDYGRSIVATSERNLPRDFLLTRGWGPWRVLFRATQYRSILDARDAPPYQRLPQLRLTSNVRDWRGFDVSTLVDATYFTRRLPGAIEGLRMVVNPTISYPIRRPGWFIEPRLSMHASAYRLRTNPGFETSVNRALPTFELDSGLVFERNTRFLGREMMQTLEPRLYYAWTPYRDQSAIPIFDSGVTEFGFAQLFSPNLFVGHDRIADVNQVTAAILSRMIEPGTGAEQFRFAIGQRLYFASQRASRG
ncbi:MAG: LPS assembly protein LptD [Burkholderiaceae bacterium]